VQGKLLTDETLTCPSDDSTILVYTISRDELDELQHEEERMSQSKLEERLNATA